MNTVEDKPKHVAFDCDAELIRAGLADMQLCVPSCWTDAEIEACANRLNPAGTRHGWQIRTDPERLAGCPVRNPCANGGNKVHVTLDC